MDVGVASCVFCDIVDGRQQGSVVYEDDVCIAFLDISPINPGHTLVVPRRHAANLAELDGASGARVFGVARRIALALRSGALAGADVRCDGVNLLLSDGSAAGQVVPHLHLHVVPRFFGDRSGFRRGTPDRSGPTRGELDTQATALASAVRGIPDE